MGQVSKASEDKPIIRAKIEDSRLVIESDRASYDRINDALGGEGGSYFKTLMITNMINLLGSDMEDEAITARLHQAIELMEAIDPQSELEAMLGSQMVVSQLLVMELGRRTLRDKYVEGMNANGNLLTKVQRTFVTQYDALHKARRGGEQVIRHVHVHPGAQAVVADEFHHHGGQNGEGSKQPFERDAAAAAVGSAALPGPDPAGNGMPVPGNAKRKVPAARGAKPRRAQG